MHSYRDPLTDSWSAIQVISTESSLNSWRPSIIADSIGQIHVVWDDQTDYDGSGSDYDIFYKKFVGPPQTPQLFPIMPNPSSSGIVNLYWSDVIGSENYYLYRKVTPISSLAGLSALNQTKESFYIDSLNETGSYYYVIVAENDYGESSFSNVEFVHVDFAESGTDLFSFISNELLIVAGILLGTQILFFVLGILIKSTSNNNSKGKSKGKSKK
ncbi:MAG: hypothetical protein KGD64_09750 [Candidatus Heimdallarchaeota archaeon]|nr:hypothetical protein [Candidatus Heimdallarchaeota archaeon]